MSQAYKSDLMRTSSGNADPDRKHVIAVKRTDFGVLPFFLLLAGTAFFATMLLVEDNLFTMMWEMVVSFFLERGTA